ncbi:hypothetical protein [Streptomyces sp. NPDC048295]|uniref:hypothetical protein n=1 Tax=Streptomyces sp. NPDC048295 TaxID=3154617 RepID=UPI00341B6815
MVTGASGGVGPQAHEHTVGGSLPTSPKPRTGYGLFLVAGLLTSLAATGASGVTAGRRRHRQVAQGAVGAE